VIGPELLGVPLSDGPVRRLVLDASRLLDDDPARRRPQRRGRGGHQLAQYFAELFEVRRTIRDDLVSGLLAAEEQGDWLTSTSCTAS
jgi:cytochrome P450